MRRAAVNRPAKPGVTRSPAADRAPSMIDQKVSLSTATKSFIPMHTAATGKPKATPGSEAENAAVGLSGRAENAAVGLSGRAENAAVGLSGRAKNGGRGRSSRAEHGAEGPASRAEHGAEGPASRAGNGGRGLAAAVARFRDSTRGGRP
ncbi:hypothetical protein GCM10018962_95770 [Dactylosporangium matsuzakiense]|uniref:Uncharacterized protein n=1 Tax=Dactylosporangium matsuzakiense TaxID=53360 RepID=A0A9W6KGD4_9ACTN|nr:hypothetical protein GCM10017581_019650 [Dactylosporangium matsuzakiense]